MAAQTSGTEFPIDPRLIAAVEAVLERVSTTPVQFVLPPRAWLVPNQDRKSSRDIKSKAGKRYVVAERDAGARCAYCAAPFEDIHQATLDHVIPYEIVKHWEPWNLVLACEPCNNHKDNKIPAALMPLLCSLLHQLAVLNAAKRRAKAERRAQWQAKTGVQLALDLGSPAGGAR